MNNMKFIIVITMILISIVLSSCAGPRELDEMGILMSTALDYVDGKILLTNEIVTPTRPGGEEDGDPIYIQSTGDTVFDAYRNATLEFDRKIFLSHNRILIFGEEFARRGIGDYISFYLYDNEPRETAYMIVAKGAKAYEIMGINAGLSDTPSSYLLGLIENFELTSKTRSMTMYEYFKYGFANGTPVLGVVQKKEKMEIIREENQASGEHIVLNVAGGAAFKQDKLEGYYTAEEMIGFNFLVNEIEGGLIVFETPTNLSKDVERVATQGKFTIIEIISSRTKKNVELIDGKFHLTINVTLKGSLGDETRGMMITELAVKNAIQDACSAKVEEYIRMTFDKAQKEFGFESFDVNGIIHRKYPELWREIKDDWNGIFQDISYSVNVETQMVRTGLIDIPTNIEKGRD